MTATRRPDSASPPLDTSPENLVNRLGPHAASALDLDLDLDEGLGHWLVASVLLGGRTREAVALDAFRRLAREGLAAPADIARAGFANVQRCLEEAGVSKSESVAAVLVRVCTALVRVHGGSIDGLVGGADGLDDLAQRLSQLGAGFGKAAVLRFLTPVRERWSASRDLPTSPAVLAAGRDLGWIPATQDEEGAPASLARRASASGDVSTRDLEAALEKLGRAACLRERPDRCPLAGSCPKARHA